ncbi:MAG TPA: MHYT domain-containing protein [Alphaproteobacteria bacterium]|nr:MHYT domain-containing protein [Alphaproteobacteria bacterium]
MFRVYGCVTQQHDLWIVLLAGIVCLFACYTAFSLGGRVRTLGRRAGPAWLGAAAIVTGSGVWATHFIAMLAFRPGLLIAYDVGLTALSVVIAILFAGAGYVVARRNGGAIGGAIVGLGVSAMHFTGMAGVEAPALKHWDAAYVAAAIAIGVTLGAAAVTWAHRRRDVKGRLTAATLLALGICGMHFTAMAAFSLEPDPRIGYIDQAIEAPQWLAIAVAAVTFLIVGLGLVGAVLDEHLAGRAAREAERLRKHVAELEATKLELEAAHSQLHMAFEAAAAGSQAKSQFLATMSHELRTPLNAIIGFAEMQVLQVFGPLGDPRYHDYARDILASGRHLLELINDVLDIAKLDVGHLELQEEETDLAEVIADCINMMTRQAEAAGLYIQSDLPSALPSAHVDRRRINQVLLNLLSNAVKFTPKGGTVRVRASQSDDGVVITVADTGIGMAAEDIPKALERFGQIDSRLSRAYEGTGLGLPLAKQLIELHGGQLAIESAPGKGTTVSITIPRRRIRPAKQAAA